VSEATLREFRLNVDTTLSVQLHDAKKLIKLLQEENAKLRRISAEDRRRADVLEDGMRRAYSHFASTVTRR
jgi:hypothetical protein